MADAGSLPRPTSTNVPTIIRTMLYKNPFPCTEMTNSGDYPITVSSIFTAYNVRTRFSNGVLADENVVKSWVPTK